MLRSLTHPAARSRFGLGSAHRVTWLRATTLVVVLAGVCSVTSSAHAAPDAPPPKSGEPTEAERAEERALRELMRAGAQEAEAGNWEGAARAYRSAWHLRPHFAIAMNLAEAEMKLGNYLEAAGLWQFYIDHAPPELKHSDTDAEAELAECRTHLGSVQISVEGGAATVLVNGKAIGDAPFESPLWLEPGSYEVSARRGDHRSVPNQVRLEAGAAVKIYFTFPSTDKTPPPLVPALTPESNALEDDSASASSTAPKTYVLIGGTVLTAVALGVAVGYLIKANQLENDAQQTLATARREAEESGLIPESACRAAPDVRPSGCGQLSDQWNDSDTALNIATGAFITAGILGAGTIATYFLWPDGESTESSGAAEPRTTVGLWSRGTGTGAYVAGSF